MNHRKSLSAVNYWKYQNYGYCFLEGVWTMKIRDLVRVQIFLCLLELSSKLLFEKYELFFLQILILIGLHTLSNVLCREMLKSSQLPLHISSCSTLLFLVFFSWSNLLSLYNNYDIAISHRYHWKCDMSTLWLISVLTKHYIKELFFFV